MIAYQDRVLAGAMGDLDPDHAGAIARTLRYVWFSVLLGWVNGWNDFAAITREVESATRLLLADLP